MHTQSLQNSAGLLKNTGRFSRFLDVVDELNWDIAPLEVISAYLEKLVETATEKDEGGIEGMFLSAHQIEELSTGVAACIRNINRTLGAK